MILCYQQVLLEMQQHQPLARTDVERTTMATIYVTVTQNAEVTEIAVTILFPFVPLMVISRS